MQRISPETRLMRMMSWTGPGELNLLILQSGRGTHQAELIEFLLLFSSLSKSRIGAMKL